VSLLKILDTLQKAAFAEQKQGFTNTAVIGGFDAFLKKVYPQVEAHFAPDQAAQFWDIAQNYSALPPLKRRKLFPALLKLLKVLEHNVTGNAHSPAPTANTSSRATGGYRPELTKEIAQTPSLAPSEAYDVPASDPAAGISDKTKLLVPSFKGNVPEKPKPLQFLKGVGPERAKLLQAMGLETVSDLIRYFPRRYEDRRPRPVFELKDGDFATVQGTVIASKVSPGRVKVIKLTIEDREGRRVYGTWFNQTYIARDYPIGTKVRITGKVKWQGRIPEIMVTDITKDGSVQHAVPIMPIYSETKGLSTKVIQGLMHTALADVERYFPEILPVQDREGLMDRPVAYREIHFPTSFANLSKARDRLVFEEILFLQLAVARLRQTRTNVDSPPLTGDPELRKAFFKSLPFALTGAQKRVIREIYHDMAQTRGMARLVQGDVGSGKTVVAMAALLQCVGSGYQGAMMAPTEILAWQHYNSIKAMFDPLGIRVVALVGNQTKSQREQVLSMIESGSAHVVVGTHALIQEGVMFHSLGLAITDEQHRFGVKQRTLLQSKGKNPHVLVLTATPIPRTLALTLYGDLQLSVLDEMPPGRKPVITKKITERLRPSLEKFMEKQLESGSQIYVVCPLVEESEVLDLQSATERAEQLKARFPKYRVELLHGRMKGAEKEEIMQAFAEGNIHILVSTTVVEVGVNVPNATVMIIEGAERFGLAQLHQLRGRVGRGHKQSYCILISDNKDSRRLDILCQTEDGFKIAEEDLKIRGPGELLGTKQHGITELKLADLARDGRLIERAYRLTQKVLERPEQYGDLLAEVDKLYAPDKVGLN